MKAILSKEVGGPETLVLEDVPAPEAGKNQVLIEVKACGVNYPDVLIIQDMYQFKPPRPFSPGGEIAGIVKAVGEGVTHVKPGDRVLASCGNGGMAELVVASAHGTMAIPDGMPFDEAAAFLMTYGTSYYALKDRADPKPGESLLVLGAAGGVGIAAVELGKAMGLKVIAACSTQEKVDFCLSKGADTGLVYPAGALDRTQQKQLSDDINIRGVFWGAAVARDPKAHAQNCAEMFKLYAEGKIRPHISNSYPLAKSADAIRELMDRKAMGKVVVTM